jgi:hypothetical protein
MKGVKETRDFISPRKIKRAFSPQNKIALLRKFRLNMTLKKLKNKIIPSQNQTAILSEFRRAKKAVNKTVVMKRDKVKKLKPRDLVSDFILAGSKQPFSNRIGVFSPAGKARYIFDDTLTRISSLLEMFILNSSNRKVNILIFF